MRRRGHGVGDGGLEAGQHAIAAIRCHPHPCWHAGPTCEPCDFVRQLTLTQLLATWPLISLLLPMSGGETRTTLQRWASFVTRTTSISRCSRKLPGKKLRSICRTMLTTATSAFCPPSSGRIDAEFLRLLFYHAHRESEEFFRLSGQLAQPNQDFVFSKRAAFFNGLKNKVGLIMAKASALRVNINLLPSVPSTPRPPARNKHAHQIYALDLSHHILPPHPGA